MATTPPLSAGAPAPPATPAQPAPPPAAPANVPASVVGSWLSPVTARAVNSPLKPPPAELQALADRAGQGEFPNNPYLAGLAARYFLKGMALAPLTPNEMAQLVGARQYPNDPIGPDAERAAENYLDGLPPLSISPADAKAAPYRVAIRDYMASEQRDIAADGLRQKSGNRSIALFHDGPAPRGLVVMLHGFSAGTVQWSPTAQELFKEGYDVFVPALPGHGLVDADGKDDVSHVPTMEHWKQWNAFDERLYGLVKSSGAVSLVGLSAGAMLALHIAEQHGKDKLHGKPVIRDVVAASPYLAIAGHDQTLGPISIPGNLAARGIIDVDKVLPPLADRIASAQVAFQPVPPLIPGYGFSSIDQDRVLAMTHAAEQTRAHPGRLKAAHTPTQFIVTQADAEADPNVSLDFARQSGAQPDQLLVFPASEKVPHALVNPTENPDETSWNQVNDFILSSLTR